MKQLRKGKTKSILRGSIDSALLAVEVYNKPRTTFRTQAFVSLMIMAWTRLFHAYFNRDLGDKYYYKKKNGRYEIVDGERRAWELKTCIKKYSNLSDAEKANLEFFIGLRNKIEHRNIEKSELDVLIFGECQSLLFNYESRLIEFFGEEYSLNENLVYSLQFSTMRTPLQKESNKRILSFEAKDIKTYIEKYRSALPDNIFSSQSFSVKLIQVPKISNTNRNDLAIEFVKWDELSPEDRIDYEKFAAIVKTKIVKQEAVNVRRFKPGKVLDAVNKVSRTKINHHDHRCLFVIFSIRPDTYYVGDPSSKTNTKYCLYDEVHDDYVYTEEWINALIRLLKSEKMERFMWKGGHKAGRKYNLDDYV